MTDGADSGAKALRHFPGHVPRGGRLWLVALLLTLPAVAPYASHYLCRGDRVPTGFIQGDQPNYMAVAREYFDSDAVHFLYGNPLTGDYATPRIYFQPSTFLLGLAREISGLDPGIIFVAFGFLAALVLARLVIALYSDVEGMASTAQRAGLLIFFWGGGVFVIAGLTITGYFTLYGGSFSWRALFQLDPFVGWWMLNLGRNIVMPLESYYHLLFLGSVLLAIRQHYRGALAAAFVLSLSHPYTGTQLLAVLFAWGFAEVLIGKRSRVPGWFFATVCVLLVLHITYYLVYLPSFPEHRELMAEWDQPWFLRAETIAAAYLFVGCAALWRLRSRTRLLAFVGMERNRLLLAWFVVSFLLANHQWFIHPIEPLHFTRGYVWTSLFLIGAPTFTGLLHRLGARGNLISRIAVGSVVLVVLSDNIVWLTGHTTHGLPGDVWLTTGQKDIVTWMDSQRVSGALVVSEDPEVSRMAAVYTSARPWAAVKGITPGEAEREAEQAEFFLKGRGVPAWEGRPLFIVFSAARHSPQEISDLVAAGMQGREVVAEHANGDLVARLLR